MSQVSRRTLEKGPTQNIFSKLLFYFLSPPVQIAQWVHMHNFLSVSPEPQVNMFRVDFLFTWYLYLLLATL